MAAVGRRFDMVAAQAARWPPAEKPITAMRPASTCQASIEAVEKAFQEAVAKGVEDKLKGGSPMKKAPETGGTFTREQISAMSPEEINKNWDAVQASMKNLR